MNLTIVVGDTVYLLGVISVDGVVQDLTGCTVTAKIRATDGGTVLATFTSSVPTPASGQVLMTLAPATTGALTVTTDGAQIGVWSAEITDGTDVVTFVRGTVSGLFNRAA
jgi:hypothetical protein